MGFEFLADGGMGGFLVVLGDGTDIGRRSGWGRTQQLFKDPLPAQDGTAAAGQGSGRQNRPQPQGAAADAVFQFDLTQFRAGDIGDAVVVGDLRIKHIPHEEILRQAHPPKVFQRCD